MATHSSTLAWKIPWMEEPGRLQSMGSKRVGHDFTFTFHFHALEKEMATHFSVLAWRIPERGEPGGLPSQGSHRVGHDWSDLAAAAGATLTELTTFSFSKLLHSQGLDDICVLKKFISMFFPVILLVFNIWPVKIHIVLCSTQVNLSEMYLNCHYSDFWGPWTHLSCCL